MPETRGVWQLTISQAYKDCSGEELTPDLLQEKLQGQHPVCRLVELPPASQSPAELHRLSLGPSPSLSLAAPMALGRREGRHHMRTWRG